MPQVDILLASYNGEKYIQTQIASIVTQSFQDWNLIIHDDGSSDKTLDIIRKWQQIDNRIKLVEDGIVFHNSPANFMHLLRFAEGDFIMFCDQDDLWLDNKIELMFNAIAQKDNTKPQVVYANAYIWNNNSISSDTIPFWKPKQVKDTLFLNGGIHGCISLFNRKVLELMKQQKGQQAMHDHILLLIALCFGEVTYMNESLVLFRRHNTAVTNGTEVKKTAVGNLTNKENLPVIDRKHYDAVALLYQNNKDLLTTKQKELINAYLSMPNKTLLKRYAMILKHGFTLGGSLLQLLVKMTVRKLIN
ncbi:MAG: glycosyltransferase [Bacteroidales bacterium]|jgi:rhamnosyltransferase|nr:glycosyltransferase [Bacteroidales bacterium]